MKLEKENEYIWYKDNSNLFISFTIHLFIISFFHFPVLQFFNSSISFANLRVVFYVFPTPPSGHPSARGECSLHWMQCYNCSILHSPRVEGWHAKHDGVSSSYASWGECREPHIRYLCIHITRKLAWKREIRKERKYAHRRRRQEIRHFI